MNYFAFYHFLEGIVRYEEWPELIDHRSIHKKIKNGKNEWCNTGEIHKAFSDLFARFRNSVLVISYRVDGIPTTEELVDMLRAMGKRIRVVEMDYKYALSHGSSKEVLLIAE